MRIVGESHEHQSSLKFETGDASGQQAHLYLEVLEEEHVYLELTCFPFEATSFAGLSGQGPGEITVRLPHAWARKLGLVGE